MYFLYYKIVLFNVFNLKIIYYMFVINLKLLNIKNWKNTWNINIFRYSKCKNYTIIHN